MYSEYGYNEKALADYIEYGIPDINTNTKRYANKKIAVIGGGHSASIPYWHLQNYKKSILKQS